MSASWWRWDRVGSGAGEGGRTPTPLRGTVFETVVACVNSAHLAIRLAMRRQSRHRGDLVALCEMAVHVHRGPDVGVPEDRGDGREVHARLDEQTRGSMTEIMEPHRRKL